MQKRLPNYIWLSLKDFIYLPDENVKIMTDGGGKTLHYAYDQIGRPISITDEYEGKKS